MELNERLLKREEVFSGRILHVYKDTVRLPNGQTALREVAEHPGAVAIVAVDDFEQVLLVRQYRHAIGRELLEIPAGKPEAGETPLQSAQRELWEETGASAKQWTDLGHIYAAPGCYSECISLFLAKGLSFGQSHPDADEFLQVQRFPLTQAILWAENGQLEDGKSTAALLRAKPLLTKE